MKLEPEKFPIDRHLEEIADALANSSCVLVNAQTGAGKTTRLPPYLLGKTQGKILVLEPRRLAAKLSAARCADIVSEKLGETVGHHIRFDKKASDETKLLFVTEGLFLPYLRQDPDLKEYSVIILDEFHERSVHTDLALALVRKLQATTRPDLKLVVMSATLETEKLESYLDFPRVFKVPGRTFPIDIEYHPPITNPRARVDIEESAAHSIEELLRDPRCPLNVLVFLPGMGAIRRLQRLLQQRFKDDLDADVEVVALHSSLPKAEQNKAFKEGKRKVILSTNIAETSLTIPNVTGVVDLGTERRASFAPWSGMPLLQLEKISQASAIQRAGRAGRTRSGVVYRLYTEADFSQREAFTPPEIKRVELSHHILDLLELGHGPDQLNWFEAPDEGNLKTALDLLDTLGAVKNFKITPLGRFLAGLPLHPRLAAMVYEAPESFLSDSLLAACIISEGMVLSKSAQFSQEDSDPCDLGLQMDLVKAHVYKDPKLSDYYASYLDRKKAARALDLYESLASRIGASKKIHKRKTDHAQLMARLLKGFPDRVAAKRIAKGKGKRAVQSYNFCLGRGGIISPNSVLSQSAPDFIVVLDALENPKANAATGTTIQAASKVAPEQLLASSSPFLSAEKETSFNEKKGALSISTNTKYGKLTIASESQPPVTPRGHNLSELMKENWPWPFKEDQALQEYNLRVQSLDRAKIEHNCPLLLGEMFELFLETSVDESSTYQELLDVGLEELIQRQLSPQDAYVLTEEAPRRLKLANGKEFNLSYEEDGVFIEARIQDLFSVTEHPTIAAGEIPVTVRLLTPANRVAQIVKNLPGFWKTSWIEVRKDLKARYPKHFWPERPESAEPKRISR